jgi:hypothetical protein
MMWVKCTTSAECKSIRIAASAVMDGWDGRCLAVMPLALYLKRILWKWFGVPMGYYRGGGIGLKEMTSWVTLPRDFTKTCFRKVVNKDIEMLYQHEKF